MYRLFFKRFIDLALSSIAFLLLLPFFIILVVLLAFANQGQPFFFQLRPGKDEKVFKVIKFKTMNDKRSPNGELLPDHLRLTAAGKFVRKTSLDEIPQLLNVIKGDMSLIGPRPLLLEYLAIYSEEEKRRHSVRPGITGWAQVNGRNTLTWKQKFSYDLWYIDHISFFLDIKILLLTVFKVFKAEGISAQGLATAEKYNGNN